MVKHDTSSLTGSSPVACYEGCSLGVSYHKSKLTVIFLSQHVWSCAVFENKM